MKCDHLALDVDDLTGTSMLLVGQVLVPDRSVLMSSIPGLRSASRGISRMG